jgi:hypothetical protein
MQKILGLMVALAFASAAHAQTTFTYQGNPIQGIIPAFGGFVTLDSPLAANGTTFFDATPGTGDPGITNFDFGNQLNYSLQQQLDGFHNSMGDSVGATFSFTTSNSVVTAYDFELNVEFGEFDPFSVLQESITSSGDSYRSLACDENNVCSTVTATTTKVGALTQIQQAPEVDPRSAASGLTLLLGAVAVLRGRRTRRVPISE